MDLGIQGKTHLFAQLVKVWAEVVRKHWQRRALT